MKKFLILYVVVVSILTLYYTLPRKIVPKEPAAIEEEAEKYKQRWIRESNISENRAEAWKQEYIEIETRHNEEKVVRKMGFFDALRLSSFIFISVFGVLWIVYLINGAHYGELYGSSNSNSSFGNWIRFMFKK